MADYVCRCFQVTEEQIKEAIANGAKSVEEIGVKAQAGNGCGSCKEAIEAMLSA